MKFLCSILLLSVLSGACAVAEVVTDVQEREITELTNEQKKQLIRVLLAQWFKKHHEQAIN